MTDGRVHQAEREAADLRQYARNIMVDFTQMKSFSDDPLILTEGKGCRVRDVDGQWYWDGLAGTFCMSLGHGNERVVEAGSRQLARLAMAAPTLATSDRSLELTKILLDLLPERYTHLKWSGGGSEAIEVAIKMARQYEKQAGDPRKYKILSHYRAYHGVTGQALAATGWPHIRNPYEPLPGGFVHLHTPDSYRPPFNVPADEVGPTYARLVEETVLLEGPETIAALITEPILMSAGVVVPPRQYLPQLREICDRYGILLIFDEIITGFGRTGELFASQLFGAWPDILVLGKGISGGYAPLSATVVTEQIASAFWGEDDANVHYQGGHTYAGNPFACAIGIAAIAETLERGLVANARARGLQALDRLRTLQERVPSIGDVRGEGLLLGLEFVRDRDTKERFASSERIGIRIRDAARQRGLLVRTSHWMAVIAPPLTITEAELGEVLDRFEDAVIEVLDSAAVPAGVR